MIVKPIASDYSRDLNRLRIPVIWLNPVYPFGGKVSDQSYYDL